MVPAGEIYQVAFSPNGQWLALGNGIVVWDVSNGRLAVRTRALCRTNPSSSKACKLCTGYGKRMIGSRMQLGSQIRGLLAE